MWPRRCGALVLHGAYFDVATGQVFVRDGTDYVEIAAETAGRTAIRLLLADDIGSGPAQNVGNAPALLDRQVTALAQRAT